MSANRYDEALADTKKADELEPLNPKVMHRLARIYTALGRPHDALDVFDHIASVQSVTSQEKSAALSMQKHVKQAEDSLREGTAGSMVIHAIDQAERGLGNGVEKPRKWQLIRGEAYLKMGNVNALGDAQGVAMSLLRRNSKDPEALVLRGRALYGQGDNEKALQHFREALNCDPDFKDGVKYLRMVQKLDKMKEQGNAAFKAFKYRDAVSLYGKALEIDPQNKGTNSKILQNRAMAYLKVNLPPVLQTSKLPSLRQKLIPFPLDQRYHLRPRRLHPRPRPRPHLSQSPQNQSPRPRRLRRLGRLPPRIQSHRRVPPPRTRHPERNPECRARAQEEQAQGLLQDPWCGEGCGGGGD